MPLLRPSASDYTTVVRALANAGAAVTNPQGSRPPSKGSVALVSASRLAAIVKTSYFTIPRTILSAGLPNIVGPVVPTPLPGADPNYTTYETSLFVSAGFWGGNFTRDVSGNLYGRLVNQNHNLYKVAPNGTQTFIAGDGVLNGSFIPGVGSAVRFDNGTKYFVIDSLGNLFGVVQNDNIIIKIEPNGNATSYAGGVFGVDDGNRSIATFSSPLGITIDASNTLYVSEVNRKTIRKITSGGQVSTLTFSAAFNPQFYNIAADSNGILYAIEPNLCRVYKITPTGPTTADIGLFAGSTAGYANGQGIAAQFNFDPSSGLCVDTFGNVYVGDSGNGSIRKITPSGLVSTIAGNGTNASGFANSNTQLYSPSTPSIDANGVIYVGIGDVRKISPVIASLPNAGGDDIFVVKYDSNGVPLWARRISGGLTEGFRASQIDSAGNVIVSGTYTSNPVTIYGGGDSVYATLDNPGLSTTTESFIVKYNSSGAPQWVRRIGGTGNDVINFTTGIVLSGEDIIVSGSYSSNPVTIFNADGSPSFTTLTNAGASPTRDSFIVKYNSSGTPQWVRRIGGTSGSDDIGVVRADSSGNVVVFMTYSSTSVTIFNEDQTSFATLANAGSNEICITKYNSSGIPQWVRRIGGSNSESNRVSVIDSSGNVITTVDYQSNPVTIFQNDGVTPGLTFANATGTADMLIVKYASNGDFLWARRLGSPGTANGESVYSLNVDSNGNSIVSGTYIAALTIFDAAGNAAFDPLTFIGGQDDAFIVKYSPNGTPLWVRKIAGSGADQPVTILLDLSGNIILRMGGGPSIIYDASQNPLTSSNRLSIVKYDTNGTLLWHTYHSFTGAGSGFVFPLSIDSNNNIIAGGSLTNCTLTLYDSSGNAATTFTNTENQSKPFIVKYSPSGNILWAKRSLSGPLADSISSVRIDSTNNLVVTGTYASNPLTIT